MLRIITALVLAALLAGCASLPLPTPDRIALFYERYDALDVPYDALVARLNAPSFDDPAWCDETARLAREWLAAIDALRTMEPPAGDNWATAWPVLMQGMDEYAYAAKTIENAAEAGDPALMLTTQEHIVTGVNFVYESIRLMDTE